MDSIYYYSIQDAVLQEKHTYNDFSVEISRNSDEFRLINPNNLIDFENM